MKAGNRKKPERSERRTADWIQREAAARGLKPGRKVRIETLGINGEEHVRKIYRSGKVTRLYPYIFVCEVNGIAECFRYNQLVGNEIGEKVILNG